jgi:hypothetical protein
MERARPGLEPQADVVLAEGFEDQLIGNGSRRRPDLKLLKNLGEIR